MRLGNANAPLQNAQPHPPWHGPGPPLTIGQRARLFRALSIRFIEAAGSGVIELRQWTDLFFCSEPQSVLCIPFPG